MRLTQLQAQAIKTAAAEIFGQDAEVWLFGSRVDDDKRGGDIDLYIELPAMKTEELRKLESRFWIRLQRALGEQKIDIVTHLRGRPLRPIDQQARKTGICL
jgi:predicted nucleotidyltransferase